MDFDGQFIWYGAAGIGTNGRTGATTFHLPGKNNNGYVFPKVDRASFGFSISQGPVSTRVNFGTGKSDFRVVYLPALFPELQTEVTFGTTDIGFVNNTSYGVQSFTQWQADPYLTLDFRQILALLAEGDPLLGNALVAQNYRVTADYDGSYRFGLDYLLFTNQDAAPIKFANNGALTESWARDGRLDAVTASSEWFGDELGEARLEAKYVKSYEPVGRYPGGLPGRQEGQGFFTGFLGRGKSAGVLSARYSVSVFRFVDPEYYDPDGRDLKITVDGTYAKPFDPLPEVAAQGDFYRLHLNVSYRIFGGVVVWSDLNYTEPSVKREDSSDVQRYAELETTVQFKTRPLSPEYFEISWTHPFPSKGAAERQKMLKLNPGDTEVFEFRAGIYW